MNKAADTLRKKLLRISSAVYVIIIISLVACIALLLSSLLSNLEANDRGSTESGVATFDYYKITRDVMDNSVIDVRIFLENGDELVIDSEDCSAKLGLALIKLEKGDELNFVLSTESGYVLRLTGDDLIYERGGKPIPVAVCVILLILALSAMAVSVIALALHIAEGKKQRALIDRKIAEFGEYSYKIALIMEDARWVMVKCNELDARETGGTEAFSNLLKRISLRLNKGDIEGTFLQIGEMRYLIKNDPLSLVYQYDTMFGIVIEFRKATNKKALLKFLRNIAQIECDLK